MAHDTEIFGVSADSKQSHQHFAQKHSLPYKLLMDSDKSLRKSWKVPKSIGILDGRVSYLIDKKGVCQFVFQSALSPTKHIDSCLDFLRNMR